jgi:predicted Zn-dependent protease
MEVQHWCNFLHARKTLSRLCDLVVISGQVDITSGKFVFSANEAYLIKNGKISHPVKGATLIGSGDEALKKISMVANTLV